MISSNVERAPSDSCGIWIVSVLLFDIGQLSGLVCVLFHAEMKKACTRQVLYAGAVVSVVVGTFFPFGFVVVKCNVKLVVFDVF